MTNPIRHIALLGLTSALTVVAHAAEDSYKFSGTLDMGYYRDYDQKTKGGNISRSNVAFDGLKVLDGETAATVKLNARFFMKDPHTGDNLVNEDPSYLFSGEATAGLKGNLGHVRFGRATTALWSNDWAYDAWYNYDQIASPAWQMWHGNSPADPHASSKNVSFARINHGVFYTSPKWANFTFEISMGLKKQNLDKNNSMSYVLKYEVGPFSTMVATEKTPAGNQVNFFAAKYKFDALTLMGAYDEEKLLDGSLNRSPTISAQYVVGKTTYLAGYGQQLDQNHANFYSLGATYAYKPNINVYVSYGNKKKGFWGRTASADAIGVGMSYLF